jgi:hypothetical protein
MTRPELLESGKTYVLPLSKQNEVLLIFRNASLETEYNDAPAGRSYDGNLWEPMFPLLFNFDCHPGSSCQVSIPQGDHNYVLKPFSSTIKRNDTHLVSDYLMYTSFGPTRESIFSFPQGNSFKERAKTFIKDQMKIAPTLHRAYYRAKVNPVILEDNQVGGIRGPCEVGSRWQRAALDPTDNLKDPFTPEIRLLNGNEMYLQDVFVTLAPPNVVKSLRAVGEMGPWFLCNLNGESLRVGEPVYFHWTRFICTRKEFQFNHPAINFGVLDRKENLLFT